MHKKITIRDVSRECGYSTTTVSHVLNNTRNVAWETRKKVLEAVKKLNYRPNLIARSLKGKGSKTIGIIISDIREGFFAEITKTVEIEISKLGYNLILCDSEHNFKKEKFYFDILHQKGVDGIILAPVNIFKPPFRVNPDLKMTQIPFVQIDRKLKNVNADFVGINNFLSSKRAVEYLYKCGYKSIGLITYPPWVYTMQQRIKGYVLAEKERGKYKKQKILVLNYDSAKNKEMINNWIKSTKLDAIVCGNDEICLSVLSVIEKIGLNIPEEIGLLSFDDNKWFKFLQYPVVAIKQPTYAIAKIAVSLLIEHIENRKTVLPREIILPAELVTGVGSNRGVKEYISG